jgi:hypothetical protein
MHLCLNPQLTISINHKQTIPSLTLTILHEINIFFIHISTSLLTHSTSLVYTLYTYSYSKTLLQPSLPLLTVPALAEMVQFA